MMFATSISPLNISLAILTVGAAATIMATILYVRHTRRLLNYGDAFSLLAIATLSEHPARFDEVLLNRLTERFAMLAPRYATRENAATILAVLEECGALARESGILSLTHTGLQMRLALAKGQPARGLASAFKRKRRSFSLTVAPAA